MQSLKDNLEKMLVEGRDDAMLRFGLGSAYFNEKNFTQAIPHLEVCIKHDAKFSAAYKLLGKALFKVGKNEEARSVFETGLPIAIDNPPVLISARNVNPATVGRTFNLVRTQSDR